jgi:hypothetical protein
LAFARTKRSISGANSGDAVMELFLGEKIADFEGETSKVCRFCGEKLKLIRTMVASGTGRIVHMFECRCGQRTWED